MGELLTSEVKKKEREISTCIKRTIYISLLFFNQDPVPDGWWHLLNSHCSALTLEIGVGGLGDTWRWQGSMHSRNFIDLTACIEHQLSTLNCAWLWEQILNKTDKVWDTMIFIILSPCAWTAQCRQYYKWQKQTEEEVGRGRFMPWLTTQGCSRILLPFLGLRSPKKEKKWTKKCDKATPSLRFKCQVLVSCGLCILFWLLTSYQKLSSQQLPWWSSG